MPHDCSQPTAPAGIYPFDARGVAKRFRHAAIFGALDALQQGEVMRFCNDHDPLPLLRQIEQYFGDRVQARYVAREPGEVVIDFLIAQ
ncbi:uncharacterized protein DUF2249 [Pseudoduganella flava]|uniref:DUF2249 domain-containing protein n=1 Tax=Pseudoduganella flava TaxID=871742 RepID=A0A562PBI3_9BURK|nr:DUF2249 domain-containing protein [Pseudoduganella flava]QGZ37995.1 DUF2249 domain-containing protein [Pseudoduganella flava]TWI41817.1 uncharacterized protein DUF2249 [Pseudoduganella flava]